jgi:hypothetical protein
MTQAMRADGEDEARRIARLVLRPGANVVSLHIYGRLIPVAGLIQSHADQRRRQSYQNLSFDFRREITQ